MTNKTPHPHPDDESVLIDYSLGRCPADQAREIETRLHDNAALQSRIDDIRNTLAALDLLPEAMPPEGLADRTVQAARQQRATRAAATRAELGRGRPAGLFSLRELGAIAAAMMLLAFVFVPSVRRARTEASRGQCRAQAGLIGTGLRTFANAHNGMLPAAAALNGRWLPASGKPAVSNSICLFRLVRLRLVPASPFQCPEVWDGEHESFEITPDMVDFPAPRFVNVSFQHSVGRPSLSRIDRELAHVAATMAILADQTPIFREGQFLRDRLRALASDNHHGAGQNVLYLDMHVDWRAEATAGVGGNNIFLNDKVTDYQGDEKPATPYDSFLLPNGTTYAPR
jgi:anti-sigma factor RsiW